MLDKVLETKVFAINVKANVSKPFDAVIVIIMRILYVLSDISNLVSRPTRPTLSSLSEFL